LWGSKTGKYSNFDKAVPVSQDDAYEFTLDSKELRDIRWMAVLGDLIIGTGGSEWVMRAGMAGSAVSISNVDMKQASRWGAAKIPPLVVGDALLFIQRTKDKIRDYSYSLEADGFKGNDLLIMANHLTNGFTIESWCYQQNPNSIIWCVRSDGKMIGLTYYKEQAVLGWHLHETDGLIEDAKCISDSDGKDVVYLLVKRTIDGSVKRFIETLEDGLEANEGVFNVANGFFVDSGLSYSGTPITAIAGLDHLEGETVIVLADGNVVKDLVVDSGSITIPYAASKIHVGLPYTAKLETLDVDIPVNDGNTIQDRLRGVSSVVVRLQNSRGLSVGPNEDRALEVPFREDEDYGEATGLFNGDKEIPIECGDNREAKVFIMSDEPIPLTISSLISRVDACDN
jgi:hypothetical protein